MEYKRFEDTIVLRLDPGEEIAASILAVAEKENITAASVSGIGAANDIKVGVFNTAEKKFEPVTYTGDHEITDLCGNLSVLNGKPYQHLHITLAAADGSIRGGHMASAVCSLTAEIVIRVLPGVIDRTPNAKLGINTMF